MTTHLCASRMIACIVHLGSLSFRTLATWPEPEIQMMRGEKGPGIPSDSVFLRTKVLIEEIAAETET